MHARPLMFMFLSWRHSSVGLAIFLPGFHSTEIPNCQFQPEFPLFAAFPNCCLTKYPSPANVWSLLLHKRSRGTRVHIHAYAQTQWEAGNALLIWAQCESHVREDSCASPVNFPTPDCFLLNNFLTCMQSRAADTLTNA